MILTTIRMYINALLTFLSATSPPSTPRNNPHTQLGGLRHWGSGLRVSLQEEAYSLGSIIVPLIFWNSHVPRIIYHMYTIYYTSYITYNIRAPDFWKLPSDGSLPPPGLAVQQPLITPTHWTGPVVAIGSRHAGVTRKVPSLGVYTLPNPHGT